MKEFCIFEENIVFLEHAQVDESNVNLSFANDVQFWLVVSVCN